MEEIVFVSQTRTVPTGLDAHRGLGGDLATCDMELGYEEDRDEFMVSASS